MRENIEVVDWSAPWLVPVQLSGEVDLPSVLVDEESSIVCKLTCQAVPDLRLPVQIRVSSPDLRLGRNLGRLNGMNDNRPNTIS